MGLQPAGEVGAGGQVEPTGVVQHRHPLREVALDRLLAVVPADGPGRLVVVEPARQPRRGQHPAQVVAQERPRQVVVRIARGEQRGEPGIEPDRSARALGDEADGGQRRGGQGVASFLLGAGTPRGGRVAEHVDEGLATQTGVGAEGRASGLGQRVPERTRPLGRHRATELGAPGGEGAVAGVDPPAGERERIGDRAGASVDRGRPVEPHGGAQRVGVGAARGRSEPHQLWEEGGYRELGAAVRGPVGAPVDLDAQPAAAAVIGLARGPDGRRRALLEFGGGLQPLDAAALEFVPVSHRKSGWTAAVEQPRRVGGAGGRTRRQDHPLGRTQVDARQAAQDPRDARRPLGGVGREDQRERAGPPVVEAVDDEAVDTGERTAVVGGEGGEHLPAGDAGPGDRVDAVAGARRLGADEVAPGVEQQPVDASGARRHSPQAVEGHRQDVLDDERPAGPVEALGAAQRPSVGAGGQREPGDAREPPGVGAADRVAVGIGEQ